MDDVEAWEMAEAMVRERGYISLWSLPKEKREQALAEAAEFIRNRNGAEAAAVLSRAPDEDDWI